MSAAQQETEGVLSFPAGFRWGAATASYQIEGAAREDGRGVSIWDTFCRTPGKVHAGHTGDVACDHYHRYREDVALMAGLGLQAYRFSVAWPRVQPDGTGPVNHRGLDFYDRLVDELCAAGIEPAVTLYHWDLPQQVEDRGGWAVRETAEAFAQYAAVVHSRLGDRVGSWLTLNEPWCAAFLGYASGLHAPGRCDPGAAFAAAHHLLLGHGLAVRELRAAGAEEIGIVLNPAAVWPADPLDQGDVAAARLVDGLQNRIFLDPLLRGRCPDDVLRHAARFSDLSHRRPGDEEVINEPIDVLGVNYYAPAYVRAQPGAGGGGPAYPGTEGVAFLPPTGDVTDVGWAVDPAGLTRLLLRLTADYPGVPLLITENGAAYPGTPDPDGQVRDTDRLRYLDGHLRAAWHAMAEGVDLRGYFVWSLLDNFEWNSGYDKRFGIVHVDYRTQQRLIKQSGHWYAEVIARHGLAGPPR